MVSHTLKEFFFFIFLSVNNDDLDEDDRKQKVKRLANWD